MGTMTELFFVPIMGIIINTCFEYLRDHVKWHAGMKNLERRLRDNYPIIRDVVSAASQAHIIDQEDMPLNKWIWQLRDAIDEADDLLDEFAYMEHKEGLCMEHEERLAKNKKRPKVDSFAKFLCESPSKICKVTERFFKTNPNLKRLKEVVQKLDKISAEVSNFLPLLESIKQEQQVRHLKLLEAREEGSLPSSNFIGRDKEMGIIRSWLTRPDEIDITTNNLYKNISLLSIVGHGGMGKTRLLQHVYHQDELTKEFNPKIWVCVSNNFDIKKLIAKMLESSEEVGPSLENINVLQERLKSKVMFKKFLLVLDDIWDGEWDTNKWETVLAPLAYGSLGSKILITTRMDCVASMISKVIRKEPEKLSLEGLKEDECLMLLKTHAFANVKNHDDHKKLKLITKKLAKKLCGCPLAAKVMGDVLNEHFDESHWTNVLKSDLGRNRNIFLILSLSYIFLPKHLQNCFTFCSIFPQDHNFDKVDLVQMWIAVRFIHESSGIGGEALEDIGGRYFENLVEKSFFDKPVSNYYKMYELLHDMARFVSTQECYRFVGVEDFTGVRETIRHLYIKTSNSEVLNNLENFKNLRTLWITYDENIEDFDNVLTEIFKKIRSIRLLYIDNYRPKLIPKTIEYLIHLRYLRLDYDDLTLFSKPLRNLYHLQFIKNTGAAFEISQAFDMSCLSNLRHTNLDLSGFPGIGKLKDLQELRGFCVKNEIKIWELEQMNNLRILDINGLENVRCAEEACIAKLSDKVKLTNLSLNWAPRFIEIRKSIAVPDLDEKVLENLQPHHYLNVLKISNYMGAKSATWMNDGSIYNLVNIKLKRCLEWQFLPPFWQLPFLQILSLQKMPKVKRLAARENKDEIFGSLEILKIDRLEALEDWVDGEIITAEDGYLFHRLTELFLKDCPNLQELPNLSPKLKKLEIENIGWKTLNCSISLERLEVRHCPNITYIFFAGETYRFPPLRWLEIEDCPNLYYFGVHQKVETIGNIPASVKSWQRLLSSLSTIPSLQKLSLKGIPLLETLTDLPPFLSELDLYKLDNLRCLYCLPILSSLAILKITKVPQLRELRHLPPSLCQLYLEKLDNLARLPCLLSLSSLTHLHIDEVPNLWHLPELPPSLIYKNIKLGDGAL